MLFLVRRQLAAALKSRPGSRDLDFLYAMARVNRDAVSLSEIGKRMGVTPQYVQNYKKRLIQAGIISQPGRGVVAFSVPYLREYLLRSEGSDE